MKFEIVDITSNKVLGTANSKAEADRTFVRLQNEHPNRKLWLKMARK